MTDRHLVVREMSRPLCAVPQVVIGSKPIDGGHYTFNELQRADFLRTEPNAKPLMRPYVGSEEFINGGKRWILALDNEPVAKLRAMPAIKQRIAAVKQFRLESTSKPTQKMANTPTSYHVTVIPDRPFLVIPEGSSEKREYVPIGWLEPPVIPSPSNSRHSSDSARALV